MIGAPFAGYAYYSLFKKKKKVFMKIRDQDFIHPKQREMYFYIVNELLERKGNKNHQFSAFLLII